MGIAIAALRVLWPYLLGIALLLFAKHELNVWAAHRAAPKIAAITAERDAARTELQSYQEKQRDYIAKLILDWNSARDRADLEAKKRKDELDAAQAKTQQLINAIPVGRSVVVSRGTGRVLDSISGAPQPPPEPDTGTQSGGKDASIAIPDSAQTEAYDERELDQFLGDSRKAYNSAYNAWLSCFQQYEGVRSESAQQSQ